MLNIIANKYLGDLDNDMQYAIEASEAGLLTAKINALLHEFLLYGIENKEKGEKLLHEHNIALKELDNIIKKLLSHHFVEDITKKLEFIIHEHEAELHELENAAKVDMKEIKAQTLVVEKMMEADRSFNCNFTIN